MVLKNKEQRLSYHAVLGVRSCNVETLDLYMYVNHDDDEYCVSDVLCYYQLVHGGVRERRFK